MLSSQKAIDLILKFEGWDNPWEFQGGASGITIPYGYDLGYEPFLHDWVGKLDSISFARLSRVVGLKGEMAHTQCATMHTIVIPKQAAVQVFENVTLPRYEKLTQQTFPNSEKLPSDAFGALVSVVFNRGASLVGDRRSEMRQIFASLQICDSAVSVPPSVIRQIGDSVKGMAHLWDDHKDSDCDLHDRRIAEAQLIYDSIPTN